jgi:O-acetyl-ADP-ribose deacetylase (regulator of RNase III)
LPARFVIHTVGPVWSGGMRGEAQLLTNCYRNSLGLAVENAAKTVAFPAISCGAYRYPIDQAAKIAVEATNRFLRTDQTIEKVIFVLATGEIEELYQQLV